VTDRDRERSIELTCEKEREAANVIRPLRELLKLQEAGLSLKKLPSYPFGRPSPGA